jgi:hypothetical protein
MGAITRPPLDGLCEAIARDCGVTTFIPGRAAGVLHPRPAANLRAVHHRRGRVPPMSEPV